MGKTALKIDEQKVLIVYEEGKAPWSKPLCKLGFHDWVMIGEQLNIAALRACNPSKTHWAGFNQDSCLRDCGVNRLWKPRVRQ